jgi:hypothetical protein
MSILYHNLNSQWFPIPESSYIQGWETPELRTSLIAFGLHITNQPGNFLGEHPGQFFFSDELIPQPRPATIHAWDRLCRIGHMHSKTFILPFLPSISMEDETGGGIQESGRRLSSLSTKSKHHARDSTGRLVWGEVYIARLDTKSQASTAIRARVQRSDLSESQILGKYWWADIDPVSSQSQIRERAEFLAGYGIPAWNLFADDNRLIKINRLLFRFLNTTTANNWALAYMEAKAAVRQNPQLVFEDFHLLRRQIRDAVVEKEIQALEGKVEKNSKKPGRFGPNQVDF